MPDAGQIVTLCYGDANTFGVNPSDPGLGRFPQGVRWPSAMARLVAPGRVVIEEGLSGRTTHYDEPGRPWRNGETYLRACVESHCPDEIVIMLGTSDLKRFFPRDLAGTAIGLEILAGIARDAMPGHLPRIILVAPPLVETEHPLFVQFATDWGVDAGERSVELTAQVKTASATTGCEFLDAEQFAEVGADGLHLTAQGHQALASAVADLLQLN
jgi:lysophospholipase L1-like esterase